MEQKNVKVVLFLRSATELPKHSPGFCHKNNTLPLDNWRDFCYTYIISGSLRDLWKMNAEIPENRQQVNIPKANGIPGIPDSRRVLVGLKISTEQKD